MQIQGVESEGEACDSQTLQWTSGLSTWHCSLCPRLQPLHSPGLENIIPWLQLAATALQASLKTCAAAMGQGMQPPLPATHQHVVHGMLTMQFEGTR